MRTWWLWFMGLLLAGQLAAQDKVEVTFQYADSLAREVAVVGDFSQGQPVPLTQRPDGKWTGRLALKPGTYAYKFLVNGDTWVLDPTNPARVTLHNFEYSALTVGNVPATSPRPVVAPRPTPPVPPAPISPGKPLIAVEIVPQKNTRNVSTYAYDEDRSQLVQLQIAVKSRELNRAHPQLTGDLYVFSRSAQNNREYQVILRESKTFDLPVRGTVEYKSGSAKLSFDQQGYRWGFKYYGYLYVLRDAQGNVILTQSVPDKLYQNFETFRDLPLNESFAM